MSAVSQGVMPQEIGLVRLNEDGIKSAAQYVRNLICVLLKPLSILMLL